MLSRWLKWGVLFWAALYIGDGVKRDYDERARLQAENLWLFKHCSENAQLRAHTDACDRVALLFAETPLEGALLKPSWAILKQVGERAGLWHAAATAYVKAHQWVFVGIWLSLFLALPRVFVSIWGAQAHDLRREAKLRAAAAMMISMDQPLRQRRRCIV